MAKKLVFWAIVGKETNSPAKLATGVQSAFPLAIFAKRREAKDTLDRLEGLKKKYIIKRINIIEAL